MNPVLSNFLERFGVTLDGQSMPIDIYTATRADLADLFRELGYTRGAEIGVERGLFSETLLKANPHLTLYSIDGWLSYTNYREQVTQRQMDGIYLEAEERLRQYGTRSMIIRESSLDVVGRCHDNSLDFVYIDGNHAFDYVIQDIIHWSAKVRSGGVIAGHDYIRRKNITDIVHVVPAVQAYTQCHNISPWFLVGGEAKETRSFFWVKP